MRRSPLFVLVLGVAHGACRIDQGLQGKDGDAVADDTGGGPDSAADSDTGATIDTSACAAFTLATAWEAAPNLACGERGPLVDDPWNAEVRSVFLPDASRGILGGNSAALVTAGGSVSCGDPDDAGGACIGLRLTLGAVGTYWPPEPELQTVIETAEGGVSTSNVAWADLEGDGDPELVFEWNDGVPALAVAEANGGLTWLVDAPGIESGGDAQPLLVDIDRDGRTDVFYDRCLFEGATGRQLLCLEEPPDGAPQQGQAVADLDLDGSPELLWNGGVYRADGTLWWRTDLDAEAILQPFVVQADGDAEAEVGWLSSEWMLYDHDGTPRFDAPKATGRPRYTPGSPCVGDFDGDGVAEAAWENYDAFVMVEMDGRMAWSIPVDATGVTWAGCSGWDVDGDGALEILYVDRDSFYILDGRTGTIRFEEPSQEGIPYHSYPTVADLDGDGHAEILYTTGRGDLDFSDGWGLVAVIDHVADAWPAAGPAWPTYDYSVRNVSPTGAAPVTPPDFWNDPGTFRGRLASDDRLPLRADLVAQITDVCAEECDAGPVRVALQAGNQGPVDVPAGLPYAVYAVDDATERLVATGALPALPAYTWAAGWEIPLAPADVGTRGLRVVADDDGAGHPRLWECDEDNNSGGWDGTACP